MSDDPAGLILSAISGSRSDIQAEPASLRAEFTASGTNLFARSERVLNEVAALNRLPVYRLRYRNRGPTGQDLGQKAG